MFLSQAKLSEFKNIVSLSEQQATNIFATTKNLKMHQHLVLIWSRQETSCDSFFLEKKTFCNSENKPTHGHISPKVIWNINSIQWYLGLVIKPSAACVERIDLRRSNARPALCCRFKDGQTAARSSATMFYTPTVFNSSNKCNQATADTVDGLRRNCTRWRMDVDPRREDRIELDGSRDGRAGPLCTDHVPGFHPPLVQFLSIAFPLSLLWFEMPLFAINIPVLWLLLGSRGEANIFLSNLRKTFFDKMQNNSLSKIIVYSLGLFGLFWTFSDFFWHLVIFLALFSIF